MSDERANLDQVIRDRVREALESDVHVAHFARRGYGLRHGLACRPNLLACPIDRALRTEGRPDVEDGHYVVGVHDGVLFVAEPVDEDYDPAIATLRQVADGEVVVQRFAVEVPQVFLDDPPRVQDFARREAERHGFEIVAPAIVEVYEEGRRDLFPDTRPLAVAEAPAVPASPLLRHRPLTFTPPPPLGG